MFFPANHYYTRHHLWIRPVGKKDAYIGITEYAQKELGRIGLLELNREGEIQDANEPFGLLYGSNRSIELLMPFNGQLLITNQEIIKSPWLLNIDPYHFWIGLISLKENESFDPSGLFNPQNYRDAVRILENHK